MLHPSPSVPLKLTPSALASERNQPLNQPESVVAVFPNPVGGKKSAAENPGNRTDSAVSHPISTWDVKAVVVEDVQVATATTTVDDVSEAVDEEEHQEEAEKEDEPEKQKDVEVDEPEKVAEKEKEDEKQDEMNFDDANPKDGEPVEPPRGEDEHEDEDEEIDDPIGSDGPISSCDLSFDEDEIEEADMGGAQCMDIVMFQDPIQQAGPSTSIPFITEPSTSGPSEPAPLTDQAVHEHINLAVK
ncbi:hypothetical protein Dimus_030539, partial [Dionaea muscipula]